MTDLSDQMMQVIENLGSGWLLSEWTFIEGGFRYHTRNGIPALHRPSEATVRALQRRRLVQADPWSARTKTATRRWKLTHEGQRLCRVLLEEGSI